MSVSIDEVNGDYQHSDSRSVGFRPDSGIAEDVLRAKGQYGRMSEMAREMDVDRRRLHEVGERAREALIAEFDLPDEDTSVVEDTAAEEPDGKVLLQLTVTVGLVKRIVVALRVVTSASIRDIVALLAIIFGPAGAWSFGKVQNILTEAGDRAGAFSGRVPLSAVKGIVLDEMFSQNQPVLAGLDIQTQYLFLAEVHSSRSGEDWKEALSKLRDEQHLNPERVVKDAGTGLASGVEGTWSGIEQRDDVFHAQYKFGKARFYLERRALGAISNEYDCEEKRGRGTDESKHRRAGQEWREAKDRAMAAIERFDAFERLCVEAEQLLKLTRPGTGELYTQEEVSSGLKQVGLAMMEVESSHARSAGKYLKNRAPGLALHLESLRRELLKVTETAGGEALTKAATRLYQATLDANSKRGPEPKKRAATDELRAAIRDLAVQADGKPAIVSQAMKVVYPVLDQRERASSAVENFNSVLRPYLFVHKSVEQNFLKLFQYYWNMRTRQWGRRKGTSAYEQLTAVPVSDWLAMLGYPCPTVSTPQAN